MHLPTDFVVAASAVRPNATVVNADLAVPPGARGIQLGLRVSAITNTPTIDMKAQQREPVSGLFVDFPGASITQKSGVGTTILTIRPDVTAVANQVVAQPIGANIRVVLTIGDAGGDDATCSVGGTWLP